MMHEAGYLTRPAACGPVPTTDRVFAAIDFVVETPRITRVVLALRIGHGLISLVFLACIAAVYVAAWRGMADAVTYAALAALAVEGALVGLSGGNCPLGGLFQRFGDETPFFELLLPARAARAAVPVLGVAAVAGAVLLVVRLS